MAKPRTSSQWREVITRLQDQRASHQAVITGNDTRRRKYALAGSQGDERAVAQLKQIRTEDEAARDATQNIDLALEEAKQYLAQSEQHDRAAALEEQQEDVSELADELITIDVSVVKTIRTLFALLEKRSKQTGLIVQAGQGLLTQLQISRLKNTDPVGDALIDGLQRHFPFGVHHANRGSLEAFAVRDAQMFDKKAPIKMPPPTPAQKEMMRHALSQPSDLGKKTA